MLVEGSAGVGKSRLLAEARGAAEAAGFRVGSSAAVQGDDAVSMAPLMSTLFDGTIPILDRGYVAEGSFPDRPAWLVHRLEALLEQAARSTPVLVCMDDVQWVDRGTAAALRDLPQRLIELPIVWMFAYRSRESSPRLTGLVSHLMGLGAETISLEPFDEAAVEQVVADIVPREPTPELLRFAGRAAGNASLLVELVCGLADEGLVRVNQGRAELEETRLPQRLCDMTRETLARLSPFARHAGAVASILGKTVAFDHVAAMLDVSPGALLAPVEELVVSEVLVDAGEMLGFRNELIRDAVIETIPLPARHALQRQAIDVLVEAGMSPIEPATCLATSSQPGDRAAIASLTAASRALGPSDPKVAAELSRRAFELSGPRDELRGPLVAEMVLMLDAADRTDEGRECADAALRDRQTPEREAEVRLSVARMSGLAPDARIEAGRLALALPACRRRCGPGTCRSWPSTCW